MENRQNPTNINSYPGHMAKAKREIAEKLKLIDIVYEVIDARMPLSSKIVDLEQLIKEKPRIMIMTKYDLCDRSKTDQFIHYYESLGYQVVAVDLMKNTNIKKIFTLSEEIFEKVNARRKAKGLKPRVMRALIVGIPNVGKSTLVNRLVGKKAVAVGNRPGVTKSLSWIRLNKSIELLDSPGILWPKLENQESAKILAMFSSIKIEILNREELAIFALTYLSKLYPERVRQRYGMMATTLEEVEKLFCSIAKKRGALMQGGQIDLEKVYQIVLQDVKNQAFGCITLDRLEEAK